LYGRVDSAVSMVWPGPAASRPVAAAGALLYAGTLATLVIAIAAIIRGHTGSGLFLMIAWYIAVLPPLVRRGERSS